MTKLQEQVREFRRMLGFSVSPAEPKLRDARLCARIIAEEAAEAIVGLVGASDAADVWSDFAPEPTSTPPDIVEAVDGIADLAYVCHSVAEAIGIDLEPFLDEVHRTNMLKEPADVDGRGKRGVKPAGWRPPRIRELLLLAQMVWFRSDAAEAVERRSR